MAALGKFKMMKVYEALKQESNTVEWYQVLAHNFARPRAKTILWLACQDRLPTKTRFKKFGILQHSLCELCNKADEDRDHILFECQDSKSIWSTVLDWMKVQVPSRLDLTWILRKSKGKGWKMGILKAVITETCYNIWMYRNSKIFGEEGIVRDRQLVTRNITDTIVYRGWMKPKYRTHIVNNLM
ncbi:uncharacterized protein LOC131628873 [Vicia villosa]|uniref:uncharacterized protein LOC131628873 n=1 Tax=Vicia villosa TaxID=3911 RepID=UPI00273B5DD9|nr:uncharacterized protein LOC131628873 [Vicia villosa]